MYTVMKNLIEGMFYDKREDAERKLDVFYAMNKLEDEEYVELIQASQVTYNPMTIEDITVFK